MTDVGDPAQAEQLPIDPAKAFTPTMHQIVPESAEALPDQAAVTDKGVLASYDQFSTVLVKISRIL
jgi:hypothetical protein